MPMPRGPVGLAAVLGALGVASALSLQAGGALQATKKVKPAAAELTAVKEARRIERETRAEDKAQREAKRAERNAKRKAEREAKEREATEREAKEREAKEREATEREAKVREAKEREAKEREVDPAVQEYAEDKAERALLAEFEAKKKRASSALQPTSEIRAESTKATGKASEKAIDIEKVRVDAEIVETPDNIDDLEAQEDAEDNDERALLAEFEAKKKASPALQLKSETGAEFAKAGAEASEKATATEKVGAVAEKAETQAKEKAELSDAVRKLLTESEDKKKASPALQQNSDTVAEFSKAGAQANEKATATEMVNMVAEKVETQATEKAELSVAVRKLLTESEDKENAVRMLLDKSEVEKKAAPALQTSTVQTQTAVEVEFLEAERELGEKAKQSKGKAELEGWRATNAELEAEEDSETHARAADKFQAASQEKEALGETVEQRQSAKEAAMLADEERASDSLVDALKQTGGIAYQEALDEQAQRMAARAAEERTTKALQEKQRIQAQQDDIDSLMAQQDPAEALQDKRDHILKFGYTKQGPCPEGEDCFIHTMSNQRGNLHKPLVVQLNRGKLGHHMFQWAAAVSLAKELHHDEFRLVLREGKYETGNTVQMAHLRAVAWNSSDYDELQKNKQKCHMWDKMPLVIDSNMMSFNEQTSWGSAKGEYHTPAVFESPDDGNLAAAVAKSFLHTVTPHKCRFWELDGYFLNQGFFRHHIDLVRAAFWDDNTAVKAEDTLRWLLWNEKAKGSAVGIHIRFGDDGFTGRNLPMSYYSKALDEIKNRSPDDPLTCVIFSDKVDEAMKRSKRFELCDSRIPMPATISDQKTFYMMSLLPNLVIADSVFSFWAARVSPNDPFVVAPEIHTGVPHRDKEYEYLAQTPGWTTVETKVGSVGPGAQKQFDEQVEIMKDTPSGYLRLGEGHCRNGYYSGHVAEEAADTFTCAKKCASESRCMFFALQKGKTCSRYNSNAGQCDLALSRGMPGIQTEPHVTYAKLSDENVAMRGTVSDSLEAQRSLGHKALTGRTSADDMTLEEVKQLDGYAAPESEWAY